MLPAHLRPSDDSSKTTQEKKSRKGPKRTENPGVPLTVLHRTAHCNCQLRVRLCASAEACTACTGPNKRPIALHPTLAPAWERAQPSPLTTLADGLTKCQSLGGRGRCRCTVCLSSVSVGQGANACFCTGHAISSQRDAQGPQAHRCRAFPPAQHSPEVH